MIRITDVAFVLFLLSLSYYLHIRSKSFQNLPLKGPKSPNIFFGYSQFILHSNDLQPTYDRWAKEFGSVYQIPRAFGAKSVLLYDPAAVNHVLGLLGGKRYERPEFSRTFIASVLGKGIVWAEGDVHKRQRRVLSPAFSHQSIRLLTNVFYDSAHKVKTAWDTTLQNANGKKIIVDVELWMNRVSLDTIGVAGFSHDFGSLGGQKSEMYNAFTSNGSRKPRSKVSFIVPMLVRAFPVLTRLLAFVNPLQKRNERLVTVMGRIGDDLLSRARKEQEGGYQSKDTSLIGTLIRSEGTEGSDMNKMSRSEVEQQMKTLIFAGYETTSIIMTWVLVELSSHPHVQTRLRSELLEKCGDKDISYDLLCNATPETGLPYLDAVVKETLRLHAPVTENTQQCKQDDVLPLSSPLTTPSGGVINNLPIPAGTTITIPLLPLNKSQLLWGEDSLEFKPERWLDSDVGIGSKAKEIQGYHHLLTFLDGPRTCLGRSFAIGETKAVIATLLRNFTFEPRDGKGEMSEIKYEVQRSILPRPKIVGEEPGVLPLLVGRIDP